MILVVTQDPRQPVRTVRCLGTRGDMATMQIDHRVQEVTITPGTARFVLESQMARAVADHEAQRAAET